MDKKCLNHNFNVIFSTNFPINCLVSFCEQISDVFPEFAEKLKA